MHHVLGKHPPDSRKLVTASWLTSVIKIKRSGQHKNTRIFVSYPSLLSAPLPSLSLFCRQPHPVTKCPGGCEHFSLPVCVPSPVYLLLSFQHSHQVTQIWLLQHIFSANHCSVSFFLSPFHSVVIFFFTCFTQMSFFSLLISYLLRINCPEQQRL